ncbi:hypothetical protein BS50DRAFT_665102 [Corynespora cassiicola Philippines]|uniref:Uncharacterized protein n=1 Tax=Corynespora cassiicola Philippines TaxID=1448308 RepID=A0A2T2NRL1_CORCC|nr:hypothetical protein BS50DRAFT_665102 [Corynespora cassiicola Philippines]
MIIGHLSGDQFTSSYIHETISLFFGLDDVHNAEFEDKIVLISYSDMTARHAAERTCTEESDHFSAIYYSSALPQDILPSGPYFLHGKNIHQAWRLYEDDLDAFIFAVLPCDVQNPVRCQVVNALAPDGIWRHVPVPSRLYAKPTADRPLAGARIALKDIYQLAGVKSTMMSSAYTELYEPDNESANYVERLIWLGATIFSGAAAALTGYSWLGYSVGSNSAGSIRAPATYNGLFSLRPSFNSTLMTGIAIDSQWAIGQYPRMICPNVLNRVFHVVGHFSHSLDDLKHIGSITLDLPSNWKGFPTKILYSMDFFAHSNSKHQDIIEEFIYALGELLDIKRENFSIAERWAPCPPTAANGRPLDEYLAKGL